MFRGTLVISCVSVMLFASTVKSASLTEQRRELSRASTAIRTAERMARADRFDEAAASVAEAEQALGRAADGLDDRLTKTFNRVKGRLIDLHARLTGEGVELPPLGTLTPKASTPPPSLGPNRTGNARGGVVSFAQHVAPILTNRCGRCHVQGSRGDVSFATYTKLTSGGYIEAGSGAESTIVDAIVSGRMPPDGSVVPPQEVRVLVSWINQGAKFDGDDANKSITQLAKASVQATPSDDAPTNAPNTLPIPMATGDETISFAKNIAPMLVEGCLDCHGAGGPRAGLSLANFERLWQGSDGGPVVVPGNSERSLLVRKLRGTAEGAQMPQNRPAWSERDIQLVSRWIDEGATFDGSNPTEPLARLSALARRSDSTADEISTQRAETAARVWRLAIPDESANQQASESFLAVGNLSESVLRELATKAEKQTKQVLQEFPKSDHPLGKGRITLYAFAKRIDYSEFATMVERRSLPRDQQGHARYDIDNPYIAIEFTDNDPDVLNRLLTTQIASLWVADRAEGRLPRWFTDGAGGAIAARIHKSNPMVQHWKDELPTALAQQSKPDDFMTDKLPPKPTWLLSYGFVDALMKKPGNFDRLIKETVEQGDFDQACQQVYKRSD